MLGGLLALVLAGIRWVLANPQMIAKAPQILATAMNLYRLIRDHAATEGQGVLDALTDDQLAQFVIDRGEAGSAAIDAILARWRAEGKIA